MTNTTDIIIVVRNALPFLKRCLHSIQENTTENYNVIIVDNNSNDETKQYLKTLNHKVIFNSKNQGFGYANNQGLEISTSKYVCFLNSDTIVPKNWLETFIHSLRHNGAIGPVSNFVSSEIQKVEFGFHDLEDNNYTKINNFTKNLGYSVCETNRLIGFCIFTKREYLDKIGYFDERYEIGNFEDDDLSLRFIERGFKLAVVRNAFIYHYGGKSFKDEFKKETHVETLNKNRLLFEEKWYNSGRIKDLYNFKKPLRIGYLLASNTPTGGVKIVYEHANRLKSRGHDVTIFCAKNENDNWFKVHVPIVYCDLNNLPDLDIMIGTYFSTLPFLQKNNSARKIHFCQGYEGLLHKDPSVVTSIKNAYNSIPTKIVVSKWLKEIVDKEYNVNSTYISNGIDNYVYSIKKHPKNKIPRILISGTEQLEIKGVQIAIEAIRDFKNLKIVRLSQFDEDNKYPDFEFHNMAKMTQDQIAKIYDSCDISISASFKVEGFSLHPLEAMASGCAVITTDNGGVNDYAVNNVNALIVEQGNSAAIKNALKKLLSNEDQRLNLIENGLKTARNYLWYLKMDELEKYFYTCLKNNCESDISACLIVKNEEENLERCLESIKNICSEIIVVDTGSIDSTISIAKKFGAKIFHYEWDNDFSAARNFSISKATKKLIFIIDADEVVSQKDIEKFKKLEDNVAYNFITRNYVQKSNVEGVSINKKEFIEEKGFGWCKSAKIRFFPNKNIKFSGQVHELVEESVIKNNLEIKNCDILIHHYGHLKKDKGEFYVKLSEKKLKNNQTDLKAIYELALQYMSLNNFDEALVLWRRALELNPKNPDILAHIGTTYNLLEDYNSAEKYFLESFNIQETEYVCKHLGICYAKLEKYLKAYDCFKRIAFSTDNLRTKAEFAFCCNNLQKWDESIGILEKCLELDSETTKSWGLLEIAYNEKGIELVKRGKLKIAEMLFQSALNLNPKFENARKNLEAITKALKLTPKRVF